MAAQHMPGPWKVGYRAMDVVAPSKKGGDAKVCDIRGWGYLTGKGEGALGLSDREGYAIQRANAALIAAAPDLLIQLRGMLGLAEFLINAVDVDTDQTKVVLRKDGEAVAEVPISVILRHARAAVAKAEAA